MSDFNVPLRLLLLLLDLLVRPAPEANGGRWHRERGESVPSEWSQNPSGSALSTPLILMSRQESDQWVCSRSSWGGRARSFLTEPGGVHYGAGPRSADPDPPGGALP